MSRLARSLTVITLTVLFVGLGPLSVTAADSQTFPETGQTSSGAFYTYWLAHGQTAIFGLPLTKGYKADTGFITQIYERAIFEWHPENPQENRVLLARLGNTISKSLAQRNDPTISCDANCETFSATNHTLRGPFRDFWQGNGGLANFGYPLTEQFQEKNADTGQTYTVQYFERNRFELHPEINGGSVLLGRLGAQMYDQTKAMVDTFASARVPSYDDKPLFTYQFADGVSDTDRSAIQDGLQLGADYFLQVFDTGVDHPVTVQVYAADPLSGSWSAQSDLTLVQVRTTQQGWTDEQVLGQKGTRTIHMGTMTHEYFHSLQDQWSGIARGTPPGPNWLVEGSAEYIGFKALDAKGLLPFDRVHGQFVKDVAGRPPPTLEAMESQGAFIAASNGTPAYSLGVLATEMLVASHGITSLQAYFTALPTHDWHDAFTMAFGIDSNTFYQQFAAARRNGFQ